MTDRDRYTIGYRALRALIEDLLRPPAAAHADALPPAIQAHLRMHCRHCGDLIDALPRAQGDPFCYACVDESPRPTPATGRAHGH